MVTLQETVDYSVFPTGNSEFSPLLPEQVIGTVREEFKTALGRADSSGMCELL